MIPILTKHLAEHQRRIGTASIVPSVSCSCGNWGSEIVNTGKDGVQLHAAHVASTFQAALDAAGATTRTEWGIVPNPSADEPFPTLMPGREYAEKVSANHGIPLVSRTVVTMPWQPAGKEQA